MGRPNYRDSTAIPDPLAVMEDAATFVAAITGMRTQLEEAGWTREHAARIVILALSK